MQRGARAHRPQWGWVLSGSPAGHGGQVECDCGLLWTVDMLWGLALLRILCLEIARVAQEAEKRCQSVFWQGPGPKAPGLEGDQGAAAPEGHQCFLSAPNCSSVPFCFPPASVAKAAAPAINICFFQSMVT